ncbi:MAG: hypothetical protein PHX64_04515 [Candidatus Omnitrophica bacterium]|nr:hypothetical protein [Candidatus Omnitrophota bacterium]MDD5310995.1 hypothetical protein [Candidatus Omnitrophota bacterium]MDD5546310.1 hypothetical protein [Candidatus Omnitrophota bacterium]
MSRAYLAVLAIAAAAVFIFTQSSVNAADNLLLNPGFESGTDITADNWNGWGGVERLNEFKHGGDWCLHDWAADGTDNRGAYQDVKVTPGTKLVFTGYVMVPNESGMHKSPLVGGAQGFLEIEWFQGETKLDSIKSESVTGATDWKQLSVSGTVPVGADMARFVVKVTSVGGSSGDAYFDDLEVTQDQ